MKAKLILALLALNKDPKVALKEAVAAFDAHIANLHRLRDLVDPLL